MVAHARRGDRGERRPLTRDAIVDAALTLLDREGLAGLSMRKLAQELGAGAASLYWHVGDKEELLSLLLDRIVGEGEPPEPDPANWQEQVKEMARESRRLLQSHRDAAQISMGRIPAGPHSMPVLERYLAVLAAAGLPAARDRLRRRPVRALRRRLRVRGEHAGAAARGRERLHRAARRLLPLAAARTSSRRS